MDEQQPTTPQGSEPQQFKPGDTITPAAVPPATSVSPTPTVAPSPEPTPQPDSIEPPETPAASKSEEPASNSHPSADQSYTPLSDADQPLPSEPQDAISWTASECIAHDKSASWYGMLALGALVLATVVYLLTRDKISTAVVIVAGLALGVYGARKPQQLRYELNEQGVGIGQKFHSYNEFRSFAVIDEGAFASISFMPLNRFGQLVTIYFDPADEDRIVDLLANRLPLENRQHDVVDRFMKRIRF